MANESEAADTCYILRTNVKWKWVEEKLQKVFRTKAYLGKKKKAIRIGRGVGFTCVLGRMYLDWVNCSESDKLPETLVIKLPVDQAAGEAQVDTIFSTVPASSNLEIISAMTNEFRAKAHANEVVFYRWLQQNDINVENIPHCYIAQDSSQDQSQGLLVIEDLGEEACALLPFDSLDPEDLPQVFDTLATIHAFSLQTNDWKNLMPFPMDMLVKYLDPMKVNVPEGKTGGQAMIKANRTLPVFAEREDISAMDELIKNIDALMDVQSLGSIANDMG